VLAALTRAAIVHAPIALDAHELIWLYTFPANDPASPGAASPVPYVMFVNGVVPYAADAQFDLSRFDFANYAIA
jgi:hypothetical protein